MKYKEYGSANARTIIFLHGGGLSWWNYREAAEMLKNEYHIIVPVLDGHAGSDKHFSTIKSNARDIISFINENLNGSVFMLCGLSLGGQVLLEMLSQQADICRYAVIESVALIPSKITNALISPALHLSYPLIKQRRFAKMQFLFRDPCYFALLQNFQFSSFFYAKLYRRTDVLTGGHIPFKGTSSNHRTGVIKVTLSTKKDVIAARRYI